MLFRCWDTRNPSFDHEEMAAFLARVSNEQSVVWADRSRRIHEFGLLEKIFGPSEVDSVADRAMDRKPGQPISNFTILILAHRHKRPRRKSASQLLESTREVHYPNRRSGVSTWQRPRCSCIRGAEQHGRDASPSRFSVVGSAWIDESP